MRQMNLRAKTPDRADQAPIRKAVTRWSNPFSSSRLASAVGRRPSSLAKREVERHHGHVDKFAGDSVMATFKYFRDQGRPCPPGAPSRAGDPKSRCRLASPSLLV